MPEIKIECPSCRGTGLYKGFAEPKGCAVICTDCGGAGFKQYQYKIFTGRKEMPDIETVIKRTSPSDEKMSYAQFKYQYPEKKDKP